MANDSVDPKRLLEDPNYNQQIKRTEKRLHTYLTEKDKTIIDIYKEKYKKTSITILHIFIGIAAKCLEENHVKYLDDAIAIIQENIKLRYRISLYEERYGPLKGLVPRRKPLDIPSLTKGVGSELKKKLLDSGFNPEEPSEENKS